MARRYGFNFEDVVIKAYEEAYARKRKAQAEAKVRGRMVFVCTHQPLRYREVWLAIPMWRRAKIAEGWFERYGRPVHFDYSEVPE